jgi:hypothetical protein
VAFILVALLNGTGVRAQSLSDGLIAHYRFDDATGATVTDSSSNARHAGITGSFAWIAGVLSGGLEFDARTTQVNLGQPAIFNTTTFSIAGWFRTDNADRFRNITSRNRTHTNRQWWVTVWQDYYGGNPDGSLVFRMSPVSGTYVDLTSGVRVDDGQWHHFAVTVDATAGVAILYLDGVEVDRQSGIRAAQIPNADAYIGSDPSDSTRLFLGGIDDLRFYNRSLGASEVLSLYQSVPVLYVRMSGSDTNSGRTPGRAYRTIQKAISEARSAGYTIHVGPGTYAESLVIGTGAGAAAVSGTASDPSRLVADTSGAETGDDPGPVVISGNSGSIATGLLISGRSHWHVEGFRFTGHSSIAVRASGGMSLIDCVVDVPPQYGVYTTGNASSAVLDCVFNFDARSGHTLVMQLTNGGSSTLRIENNRMHNSGTDYLATTYGSVVPTSMSAAHTWRYGIYAYGSNNPTGSISIRNNIISDKYVGIYGTSSSSGPLVISNNTVTGCSFPLYSVGAPSGSVISNNLLSRNYYGLWGDGLSPVRALCEHACTYDMQRLARRNEPSDLITTDPGLADPALGVFALVAGSDCIDAGVLDGAPLTDIEGGVRPSDGDGDGLAACDLGAMEQVVGRTQVRVVRWREVSPVSQE